MKKNLAAVFIIAIVIASAISSVFSGCAAGTGPAVSTCFSSFTTETVNSEVTFDAPTIEVAQSFTPTTAGAPGSVKLRLKGGGSPSGTLILTIEAGPTAPSGIALVTSILDASTVLTTGAADYTFTFATAPSLVQDTVYWIHLKGASGLSSIHTIQWIGNNLDGFTNGYAQLLSSGTWSRGPLGVTRDFLFQLGCS